MRRVASPTRLRVPSPTSIPFLLPLQEKALTHVPTSVIVSWPGAVATDHSQSLGVTRSGSSTCFSPSLKDLRPH